MIREQLLDAIRLASGVTRQRTVLIIGSQAILGTYEASQLPERATMSVEVDIAPMHDDEAGTLATLIDASLGEWSEFHQANGFYVQGVSVTTAVLAAGWERRAVVVAPDGPDGARGLCLDPHDLCVAKLVRGAEKDLEFVGSLVDAGLVDAEALVRLSRRLPLREPARRIVVERATAFRRQT